MKYTTEDFKKVREGVWLMNHMAGLPTPRLYKYTIPTGQYLTLVDRWHDLSFRYFLWSDGSTEKVPVRKRR